MMNQKNDSIESLATASLMTVASELFRNDSNIISRVFVAKND
jgi:hypothetical protein